MFRIYFLFVVSFFYCHSSYSQLPKKPTSSEIYQAIEQLNFLGSVLYIAAHPDDENTRLISHMSNAVKARTAYLSLTRGDGGQNLIGSEIRELLGVIRTQELLAARRIDGGEQLFTRANDFGFSKHPDETLAIWNEKEVLADVVWAIRNFQPDIIINRFDHRSPGTTHGHHTSSAMLSVKAFDAAADASKFPDQLKYTAPWQTKRAFFNTSWWFYGSQEKFDAADKSKLFSVDVGDFFPEQGLSNSEIAALSRSEHKSQGFGNTGTRGTEIDYLEFIKGDLPKDKADIWEGIDTSWNRVKGGKAIGSILNEVQVNYDFKNPAASIPKLVKAYSLISNLENGHWKTVKIEAIKKVIAACAGLYLEATANTNVATPNSTLKLRMEAINRSEQPMKLTSIQLAKGSKIDANKRLEFNNSNHFDATISIPKSATYTSPYWLRQTGSLGMYTVDRQQLIGLPETPREITVTFNVVIENTPIDFIRPVVYKTNDLVKGEVYKPLEIVPEISAAIAQPVLIFSDNSQKDIKVTVKAHRENLEGFIEIAHPKSWKVFPEKQHISLLEKGEEQTVIFTVVPPTTPDEAILTPKVHVGNEVYSKKIVDINYDHIPYQMIVLPSESKMVRLDIKKEGEKIAYVEGAGDVVPESLKQIGYHVTILKPEEITAHNLSQFDAVVMGIRAYNTVEALKFKQQLLLDYVKNGGNMIVQYNTNSGLVTDQLAPFPLQLSRDRVTDENAAVTFIHPNHELLNYPNKITAKDFEGWTQERGLYFPNKWAKEFTPVLSMHDKDEDPKMGSLIVAPYGKGYYIYTGLSFFREFPEGVAGAYRLFANMLSIGKEDSKNDRALKN